jgi:pyruvyltransferase
MPRVRIFSWNPRRSSLPPRLARWLPVGEHINNFGDLIGPLVVTRILAQHGVHPSQAQRECTLFSVGSVLHFARDNDVVWGAGVNGKMSADLYRFRSLDIRAVRGPLTREFLLDRGIKVPSTFGDPALLLPRLAPELFADTARGRSAITVVPNFNDLTAYMDEPNVLDPCAPLEVCLRRIAGSKLVVGSSLHAIVIAESLGIPARVIKSGAEHPFKYEDYYRGTGRVGVEAAASVEEAVQMGGRDMAEFDADRLIAAFPLDLWTNP